jgi:RNA polymerase primary sigma factor
VRAFKHAAQVMSSLEKSVGEEDGAEFDHFIADEQAESPYERAMELWPRKHSR